MMTNPLSIIVFVSSIFHPQWCASSLSFSWPSSFSLRHITGDTVEHDGDPYKSVGVADDVSTDVGHSEELDEYGYYFYYDDVDNIVVDDDDKDILLDHNKNELKEEKVCSVAKSLRQAAQAGDFDNIVRIHQEGGQCVEHLNEKDENGWQVIHEAVRSGRADIVEYLFHHGADIGSTTKRGGTALWWAKFLHEDACINYLDEIGAPDERDQKTGDL